MDMVVSSSTLSCGEVGLVGTRSGRPTAARFFNQAWEEEGQCSHLDLSPPHTFLVGFLLASSEFT